MIKETFLEGVYAGYEVMRIVRQNKWVLLRCWPPLRRQGERDGGTRIMYREG
jgi:hypothetical protein